MGANFQTMNVDNEDKEAVRAKFNKAQHDDRYDNGHSYSGGFGMASGLCFDQAQFSDDDAADEWLEENAEKWGDAIAVRVNDSDGFHYRIGAWCAS